MTRLINSLSGAEMWVADDRVDYYLAAGHKLAADTEKPTEPDETEAETKEPEAEEPKKTTKRKR